MEKIAFRCIKCSLINVISTNFADGNHCCRCGGQLVPIGEAAIVNHRTDNNTVQIKLECTGGETVISQLNDIEKAARLANKEISRIKESLK